ncbi:nucleotidyltransferase family protein [Xenorhabdus bovienii]|uniref:nucleotidyltransferase family protein n=1 Tax=Xenorhabdus bovienii TaxID=40576 RepID=UPI00237CE40D|nr:nucleotidyltransferase family protein [Xenorhabdus bovienii]MDE1487106.1 nucleotidyltransferase family protein [Xenorhabdus bovienii]MDE9477874.1 nucleotidyltransferase family protein [Xenorhabdus bovienii]MDE9530765.1 nucleotidyltransferase family protein [Xenorhabdus bovienii]
MFNFIDKKNMLAASYIINDYLGMENDGDLNNVISVDLHFLGKHKLVPIWFDLLKKHGEIKKITKQTYYMVSSYIDCIKKQQEIKLQEIKKIGKYFEENNLPYALRKGVSLSSLYKDHVHRNYNDIDLLINKSQIKKYLDILYSEGYIEGIYDYSERKITSCHRSYLIKYNLSPDHYQPLIKLVDNIPVVIDLAYTSCWHTHPKEKTFNINHAETEFIDGIHCLSGKSIYYDTVFHLYRESRFFSSLEGRPPFLLNYMDLMLLKKSYSNQNIVICRENEELEKDIEVILSNDIDRLLNYKIELDDINNNPCFSLFLYMSKSSKKESREIIENIIKY